MDGLKDRCKGLLLSATEFQGQALQAREVASIEYRKHEKEEENSLRIIIDGLIADLASNMTKKVEKTDDKISYQISLSASYIRTHYIINDMILNGDLIEATTLIRKQLESLTRMHELDNKPLLRLIRKTPNVINVFQKSGKKTYPHLSEVAHFASPKAGELLHVLEDGEYIGPSLQPIYTELAHGCFDLQVFVSIYFLVWFIGKQEILYPNLNLENDMSILLSAFKIALEQGVIVPEGDGK